MNKENNDSKYAASIAWANTVLWLGFWFLLIGGCTAVNIWGNN
jgi:hypothetical protein